MRDGTATEPDESDATRAQEPRAGTGNMAQEDSRVMAADRATERVETAETVEASGTGEPALGRPGRPLNRRSPYLVGLFGAAGVATTYGLLQLLVGAREVLILVGLALFLAIGLDPAVRWLSRWMPRPVGVLVVALVTVGVVGGFLAAAIPPLVTQSAALIQEVPAYLKTLQNHSSTIGKFNQQYHLQDRLTKTFSSGSSSLFSGVLGAGQVVLSATTETFTVLILTLYFLADLPRIRRLIYRMIPNSRRPRAILLGDEMFAKVGGFVLGNLVTSLIAGVGTFVWLIAFSVPYPLLLALMVALLDLIPIVGSTIAGAVVSLVALTVSFPVALATLVFYVAYRLAEDYLIVPRVIGRAVEVPATVTIVAVLLGGTILGIVGALVAIPIAAALRIVLQESVFPRLDQT